MAGTNRATEVRETGSHWRRRLVVVVGAVLAAVVVFLIADAATDGVTAPAVGSQAAADLDLAMVIVASGLTSLVGWILLALLERFTSNGGRIWTVVASVVLLLSLSAPLTGTGITAGDRVALVLMHLAVGAVLIPLLPRRRA